MDLLVSRCTIHRQLVNFQFRSRHPFRQTSIGIQYRQFCPDWCRYRSKLTSSDRRNMIFSDGYRFSLSTDEHRIRVGLERSTVSSCIYYQAIHCHKAQWNNLRSDLLGYPSHLVLLRFAVWLAVRLQYVFYILQPAVLHMISSVQCSIFQQNNTQSHTARHSQQYLERYNVL